MTIIDAKEVAQMLKVKESLVRDRVKPSTPKAHQIPHFALPGPGKRRLVRFHREVLQAWIDASCPSCDVWEKQGQGMNTNGARK